MKRLFFYIFLYSNFSSSFFITVIQTLALVTIFFYYRQYIFFGWIFFKRNLENPSGLSGTNMCYQALWVTKQITLTSEPFPPILGKENEIPFCI